MSGLLYGKCGTRKLDLGAEAPLAAGRNAVLLTQDGQGRYIESVQRGNVYYSANNSPVTLGTALTATIVTYALYNPSGSGITAHVLVTRTALVVNTANGAIVYAMSYNTGAPTSTTPLTVRNALTGVIGGKIQSFSACTVPTTPTVVGVLGNNGYLPACDEPAGIITVPPNCVLVLQGVTANYTAMMSMMWEEVPV